MTVQLKPGIVIIPPMLEYKGPEDHFDSYHDAKVEFEKIAHIIHENNMNIKRAVRSTQEILNNSVNEDGYIKNQINHQHIEKESVIAENVEMALKPFLTNLMFRTQTYSGNVGQLLQWSADGIWSGGYGGTGQNANIYWSNQAYTTIINYGEYQPLNSTTRYFYLDTREGSLTLANTTTMRDAIRDGRIVLCMARRTKDNVGAFVDVDWRHTIYGGGIHIGKVI